MSRSLSRIGIAVAVGLFLLVPLWAGRLRPDRYQGGRSRDVRDRAVRNSSAVATMLGEIRTSMSDVLFIKTERYLHSGVSYVPHMEEQMLAVTSETKEMDEHQQEVAEGEVEEEHEPYGEHVAKTVIQPKEEDFRGFIGDLHRKVKPWHKPGDPHQHTDGTELLPWYRITTLADPHNVRGYTIGGWWLKYKNVDEAIRFVQEGVRNNPEAFKLHYMLGQVYFHKGRQLVRAGKPESDPGVRDCFEKCRVAYHKAADLTLIQRPPAGPEDPERPDWTIYVETDARAALRLAVFTEQYYGQPEDALGMAKAYLEVIPDDEPLQRIIERLSEPEG